MNKADKGLHFDVGANVGEYTQYLLSHGAERVVAVEPNPDLATYLRKERFVNDSRVSVLDYAVSDQLGHVPFRIANASTISTCDEEWVNQSRFSGQFHWAPPILVPTVSLDYLVCLYGVPKTIKVDVEGYELHALRSLTTLLPETEISFEWTEEKWPQCETAIGHLSRLGYDCFGYILNTNIHGARPGYYIEAEKLIESIRQNHVQPGRRVNMGMIFVRKFGG